VGFLRLESSRGKRNSREEQKIKKIKVLAAARHFIWPAAAPELGGGVGAPEKKTGAPPEISSGHKRTESERREKWEVERET